MKVKVVKWCRRKWNKHNLMYIYQKQCEIKQKNQWNSSNGKLHWFPIDNLWKGSIMDQNYANAIAFFSNFSEVSRVCHQKADVQGFPMMWLFLLLKFVKPELWLVKVGSNLKTKNKVCLICVQDVCIIDLVLTHLNHPWGPPWTLATLGNHAWKWSFWPFSGIFRHVANGCQWVPRVAKGLQGSRGTPGLVEMS